MGAFLRTRWRVLSPDQPPAHGLQENGKRLMSWRREVMGIDGGGDFGGQVQGVYVIGQEESQ